MARGGYNANAPLNRTAEGTAKPDPSLGVLWRPCRCRRTLRCPVLEERLCGVYVEGAGEQEALSCVAVLVLKQGELLLVLDALREGLESRAPCRVARACG